MKDLIYIVLWATSLLILWGFMTVENGRLRHEIEHIANAEPYMLKKKLHRANEIQQGLATEVMRLDRKLEIEKEKNKEGRG